MLAIETASEACSIALFERGASDVFELLAHDHRVIGRGHAEHLVPMIAALPDKGKADRILVSLGPGSFTGVRIGLATARALGFAWQAEVLGYPTLALLASEATQKTRELGVTVCMNGGHGEWFVQNFMSGKAQDQVRSLTPASALEAKEHDFIVGNRAAELAVLDPSARTQTLEMQPDARSAALLCASVLSNDLTPIYGRAPDAQPRKVSALP